MFSQQEGQQDPHPSWDPLQTHFRGLHLDPFSPQPSGVPFIAIVVVAFISIIFVKIISHASEHNLHVVLL